MVVASQRSGLPGTDRGRGLRFASIPRESGEVSVDDSAVGTSTVAPEQTAEAVAEAAPAPASVREQPSLGSLVFHRPRHPWRAAVVVVLVVVLLLEGYVRLIENQFATQRAGDSAEMILKADRIREISKQDRHVDAVFFGNSMMDTAISPVVFENNSTDYKVAYNASVVGAPLQTRLRWSDEVVLKELDTDLIIVGVHPVDLLHTDFLKLNQDAQQADVIFSQVLRETDSSVLGAVDRTLNDTVALVRNRGVLRKPRTVWDATARVVRREAKPKEFDVRTEDDWREMLKEDGEISLFHKKEFKQESIKNTGPKIKENLQEVNFSTVELEALLTNLGATGKRVVVVIPPVPLDAWSAAGVNLDALHAGNKIIIEAAAAHQMRAIDFTDRGYKNGVFGDVLHANEIGSVKFSKELALELAKPA